MTVIDRQKYVAELGKLLSGMAPQDREAVLRGVNARFDEEGDDAAVIASLGSPTFAAVSVLRGYTPPEEGASDSVPMPEPRRARPEPKPVEPEPAEPEQEEPAEAEETEEIEEAELPAEPEAAELEPEPEAEPETEAVSESPEADEPAPEAGEPTSEAEPDEPACEQPPEAPEAETEQPEAPDESEPEAEPEAEAADEAAEETEPDSEPEVTAEEPDEEEAEAEDMPAESEPAEDEDAPELPPFWDGPPELPKPPKAKVGLLILYSVLGVVIGLPLTVLFTCVALGIFCCGGVLIGAAALLVSFCFLGMNVVADILLLAGAALVLAALGLLLLFFAVWFFLRCVVGFVNLILRKGREWCYDHGEVDA